MTTDTGAPAIDEEYSLPCAEALLAGTLALMTGYVQACCDSHREAIGRKIVANLQNLSQLASLTPHFRTMLWNLQARWTQHCNPPGQGTAMSPLDEKDALNQAEQRRALWHTAPDAMQ